MQYLSRPIFNKLSILTFCIFGIAFNANAALLLNGDFESGSDSWSIFGNGSFNTTDRIGGGTSAEVAYETANLPDNFSVVYQSVIIDGTDFSIGDTIQLEGMMQYLTSESPFAQAYIEVSFRNGADSALWGPGEDTSDIDFDNGARAFIDPNDSSVQNLFTGNIMIPSEITAGGSTSAVTGMRIAIAMGIFQDGDATTRVLADNLRLTRVPAPSMLFLLGLAVFFLANAKRK